MEIVIRLTDVGTQRKLQALKDIKVALSTSIKDAWYYVKNISECEKITIQSSILPKSTEYVIFELSNKLPTKPRRKFPREMIVSNNKTHWDKRIVLGKIKVQNKPYITDNDGESWNNLVGWQYAKEIK